MSKKCYNITSYGTLFLFFRSQALALPRFCAFVICLATDFSRCASDRARLGPGWMGVGMVYMVSTARGAESDESSAGSGMRPVVELDRVSLGWRDRVAVRDASGVFQQGSMTAVVGPNGAGKSTLLKGIMGRLSPLRGTIRVACGTHAMAWLPQSSELEPGFPVSTYDLVALGAWRHSGPWKGFDQVGHERVTQALEAVGLADFGARPMATLSGGQLQRALFARLLLHQASVVLLDEPFSAVDRPTTDDLMALLHQWNRAGCTVIAVLHDLDLVRRHFPSTVLMGGQVVAWGQTPDVLTPENLHMARHLCAGDFG